MTFVYIYFRIFHIYFGIRDIWGYYFGIFANIIMGYWDIRGIFYGIWDIQHPLNKPHKESVVANNI